MSYVNASLEIPSREIRERPIWYQLMYNLAAHQAHMAMGHHSRSTLPVLQRAAPSFFGDARAAAAVLLASAAQTLVDLADVVQPRRRWERARPDRLVQLHGFLEQSMEPAAAVLTAGLTSSDAAAHETDEGAWSRADVIARIADFLASGDVPPGFSDRLVRFALARPKLSYRVHYNVACYLSGTLKWADNDAADAALHALGDALAYAPASERRSLVAWARKDPSLSDLRVRRKDDLNELLDFYSGPQLERRHARRAPATVR